MGSKDEKKKAKPKVRVRAARVLLALGTAELIATDDGGGSSETVEDCIAGWWDGSQPTGLRDAAYNLNRSINPLSSAADSQTLLNDGALLVTYLEPKISAHLPSLLKGTITKTKHHRVTLT